MNSYSAQTSESLVQELLQCAICLGQLSEPRILPCCHSFCGPCLHTHIQTSQTDSLSFQYLPTFPCPTCRVLTRSPLDGIHGFLKDFRLVKFKDVLKSIVDQKKDDVCGICDNKNANKPAKSFCAECYKYFCGECTEKHNKMSAFGSHFMFNLTKKEISSKPKCTIHAEETATFFCKTCNNVMCVICVLGNHGDHDISNLNNIVSSQRMNLHRQRSELDNEIRKMQTTLFHLTCLEGQLKGMYDDSCVQIKKQSRKLVNRITSDEKKVQKELDLAYATKCDRLFVMKEDCRDHLVSYETLQSHIGCVLRQNNSEVLTNWNQQLLDEVKKAGTEQTGRWKTQEFETFLRFIPGHNFKFGKFQRIELKPEFKIHTSRSSVTEVPDSELRLTESTQTNQDASYNNNPRGTEHAQLIQTDSTNSNMYGNNLTSSNPHRNNLTHSTTHGNRNNLTGATISSTTTLNNSTADKLLSTELMSIFGGFGRSVGDLSLPYNICFTADGKIVVAENGNRRLQIFDKDGHSLNTVACGEIIPRCVTMVTAHDIAVTDELTKSIKVYNIEGNHVKTLTPPASTLPYGLAITQRGSFVFTDMIFENVTIMSQTGSMQLQYGAHGASNTTFNNPGYIDCDRQDNIYVSDSTNHSIKVFDKTGIFLRKFGSYGSQNGQLRYPKAVVIGDMGKVFVADSGNDRVVVFADDGQFLQVLLTKSHGLQRPTGLALYRSELIAVSMPDLNEVRVYKLMTL